MSISFALQLAHGRTRISLYTNSFLVIVLVPAIIAATLAYGVIGAAATWAFTNALYLLVGVPITHKYLLKGEALQWLTMDILPPLVVSIAVVGLGRAMISATDSIVLNLAIIGLLWMVATAAAAVSAAHVRATVYALTRTVLKK